MLNRRKFIGSMLALAAAATAGPAVAKVVEVAPAKPNKYKEAIRLFDRCVAADKTEVNQRFDELLAFLKDNFDKPELSTANIQATSQLLKGPADIAGIRGIPPSVADDIYPIALARLGLREYKMALEPSKIKYFDWFHNTYGAIIMRACDENCKETSV